MSETVLTTARPMCFVAASSLDAARPFYSETLGLEFRTADQYGLMFSVGTGQVLRIQRVPDHKPQPGTVFGWQVDDIEESVTALSARGVEFQSYGIPTQDARGICTFDGGDRVAWFKDPAGNTLSISQLVE
jgi:predicted enzyme related to lactoylglutathione lyase